MIHQSRHFQTELVRFSLLTSDQHLANVTCNMSSWVSSGPDGWSYGQGKAKINKDEKERVLGIVIHQIWKPLTYFFFFFFLVKTLPRLWNPLIFLIVSFGKFLWVMEGSRLCLSTLLKIFTQLSSNRYCYISPTVRIKSHVPHHYQKCKTFGIFAHYFWKFCVWTIFTLFKCVWR